MGRKRMLVIVGALAALILPGAFPLSAAAAGIDITVGLRPFCADGRNAAMLDYTQYGATEAEPFAVDVYVDEVLEATYTSTQYQAYMQRVVPIPDGTHRVDAVANGATLQEPSATLEVTGGNCGISVELDGDGNAVYDQNGTEATDVVRSAALGADQGITDYLRLESGTSTTAPVDETTRCWTAYVSFDAYSGNGGGQFSVLVSEGCVDLTNSGPPKGTIESCPGPKTWVDGLPPRGNGRDPLLDGLIQRWECVKV